ncbi:MAG: hypothetical protein BGP11_08880 [Rhodobacterales bacterium 65-51]|nr:MAG: hypothetical protein BGP11_08880 [Rhodobacterales bacterium 65-51]
MLEHEMRPNVLPILIAALLAATPVAAQIDPADAVQGQIVSQLEEQGYGRIVVSRTFLGRVRVTAERGDRKREIVVNPITGEILRDLLRTDHRYAGDERANAPGNTAVRDVTDKTPDISEGVDVGISNDGQTDGGAVGDVGTGTE